MSAPRATPRYALIACLSVALSVGAESPMDSQRNPRWEMIAMYWIAEVARPALQACVDRFGAHGTVEVRVNSQGGVLIRSLGRSNKALDGCVEIVSRRWPSRPFQGGYPIKLSFSSETDYRAGVDEVEWRLPIDPFSACRGFRDCGAGQVCEAQLLGLAADGGVCIDAIENWRLSNAGVR